MPPAPRPLAACTVAERRMRLAAAAGAHPSPLTPQEQVAVLRVLGDWRADPSEAELPGVFEKVDVWVAMFYPGEGR